MPDQLSLFDQALNPAVDMLGKMHARAGDTELGAAVAIRPRSGTWRAKVLEALAAAPDGLTDDELARATDGYLYTVAPRRKELCEMGLVRDSGIRRTTGRGRPAIVWIVSEDL